MRTLAIAFLLLFTLPAAAAEAWHTVEPEGQGFAVEMPLPPNADEQNVDLGGGKSATMRTWQARKLVTPGAIYDVTVAQYPKGAIDMAKLDEHLDNARDGAMANALGPLVSETKTEVAGHPARELVVDMTMGMHSRTRIFFDGDRMFSIGAITRKGNERSPDVERFFTSFTLTRSP